MMEDEIVKRCKGVSELVDSVLFLLLTAYDCERV